MDQCIRSWLLATVSREVMTEIRDMPHAYQVWQHLAHRFNSDSLARIVDLKRMLTNLHKAENQSMVDYLRSIKLIADSLSSIHSSISDLDLI